MARSGSSLSVLDYVTLGLVLLLQSFSRSGFVLLVYGMA